ncbi:MAG: C2 family cysteine protease [Nitrospirales bacterium]|nr:C2 family cysteine protease [Nitrospirales bacterium]
MKAKVKEIPMSDSVAVSQNTAVINPYALAELVAGRRIAWKEITNAPKLLEEILQTPYEELFDPKFEGPLYLGYRLNENLEIVPARSPYLDVELKVNVNDLENPLVDMLIITRLADLGPRFETDDIGNIEVKQAEFIGHQTLQLTLRLPERERLQRLARVFTRDIIEMVAFDPETGGQSKDWTPPNGTWSDPGQFFNEAAEFFDPIQGAVANCYYIAALSAVAWAKPYQIKHLTRATGQGQPLFTNLVRFYKPDSGQIDREVEVTDTVPLNASTNGFIYARSSEPGEIWPAIYEKAYAKLKTGINGDHPDITATAWGDCVWATAQLTGGSRYYYDTPSYSADALWDLVRANSMSYRTINPMTCWTYSSGDASGKKIIYSDANIVASHCYTVLGWAYHNGRKYIILRNPWGNTEATVQTLNDTVWLYDISWWRPINLTAVDGTFAIEASAFKTYFAGIGVVK